MNSVLKKLQRVQLEILEVIDQFCKDHEISYSLYAGTLLGAVRHRGFIPWDDDLDICMERSDYERFLQAWNKSHPEGYLLQNKDNTPAFTQSFSKIRKEHTTFLQYEWEAGRYHTGIFVDIFPIDRMPDSILKRSLFQWRCMQYQLLTREFIPPKGSVSQKLVSGAILTLVPPEKRTARRHRLLQRITEDRDPRHHTVGTEMLSTMKAPLPPELFDHYERLPFESGEFLCFSRWEDYLRVKFGDYMTLPPEDERTWKHHPIILDFEHDYEELHGKA